MKRSSRARAPECSLAERASSSSRVWSVGAPPAFGRSAAACRAARALVNKPAALLLDEPLGALDVKLRKQMQFELKRIQAELGTTFVYVTHDQEEALAMSDRIAVMTAAEWSRLAAPERSTSIPRQLSSPTSSVRSTRST